jgi:CHAD domain-containing protein
MGVAAPAGVAFGRNQQVLAQRRQQMTANRAPVGLGKAIARWANRPPSRLRKSAHRTILAPVPRPLAKLALGFGIGAAAVLAVKEVRRASVSRSADPPTGRDAPAPRDGERVRAASVAQLDLAIRALQQAQGSELQQAVHETRKAIKRVRTLQRLMAGIISRSQLQRRRTLLRDAAAELSPARDAEVALGTLEGLMRRHPEQLAGSAGVIKLHAALLAEQIAAERAIQQSGARERALQLLGAARAEIATSPARRGGRRREAKALDAGLTRIYARGRRAMRRASRRKGIAEMHRWRKRTKDLRYAAEALGEGPGARARLRRIGKAADRLGEALGEEHDLALLARRVIAEKQMFRGDKPGRRALRKAIGRRRAWLRKRALKSGRLLYAREPKRFRKRLPKKL